MTFKPGKLLESMRPSPIPGLLSVACSGTRRLLPVGLLPACSACSCSDGGRAFSQHPGACPDPPDRVSIIDGDGNRVGTFASLPSQLSSGALLRRVPTLSVSPQLVVPGATGYLMPPFVASLPFYSSLCFPICTSCDHLPINSLSPALSLGLL